MRDERNEVTSEHRRRGWRVFRSKCVSRIPACSKVFIEAIEELHILDGNFKVKNIGIFEDASTIGRFGNHRQSVLQHPADEDLRRRFRFRTAGQPIHKRQSRPGSSRLRPGFRIFFGDCDKFRIIQSFPLCQGTVGLDDYAFGGAEIQ